MPNWCDNVVTFRHENKDKIDLIENELMKKDSCQLFNVLFPRPASKEEQWYDWNVSNWGCKWDASIVNWTRDDDNGITIAMETAWAPPLQLYYNLINEHYEVYALYYEPGMGFCGLFENGDDSYYEYDLSDRESIEILPDEILEFTNLLEEHENYMDEESFERAEYNLEGDENEKSNS